MDADMKSVLMRIENKLDMLLAGSCPGDVSEEGEMDDMDPDMDEDEMEMVEKGGGRKLRRA